MAELELLDDVDVEDSNESDETFGRQGTASIHVPETAEGRVRTPDAEQAPLENKTHSLRPSCRGEAKGRKVGRERDEKEISKRHPGCSAQRRSSTVSTATYPITFFGVKEKSNLVYYSKALSE